MSEIKVEREDCGVMRVSALNKCVRGYRYESGEAHVCFDYGDIMTPAKARAFAAAIIAVADAVEREGKG